MFSQIPILRASNFFLPLLFFWWVESQNNQKKNTNKRDKNKGTGDAVFVCLFF